jgi:hypothetical protein
MGDFLFGLLNSFIYLYNMEAKLIKVENTFYLKEGETILGTSSNPNLSASIRYLLSLKNCEAIERGYDLDELISDIVKTIVPDDRGKDIWYGTSMAVGKQCFQKSLEVNDDKRFTLEDMMNCWNKALKFQDHKETLGEHIQSLQQTEWDVEVEMICPHPMDTYRCGLQYGCDGDGCNHPEQVPYLDTDGCLILKRK